MTLQAPPQVGNPYVGPTSFRLGDPLYGRDQERQDLLDLLIAERIVLLYSPSGAGKTSLIQAALVPALREAGFDVLPVIRVTHALEPGPGVPVPRNRYVMGTLLSLEEGVPSSRQRPVEELATLSLREYLTAHGDRDGSPGNEVLLFDQFEEVLTADPTDEPAKHDFFREVGEALRDRGYWALFSMREDFLAAMDPYLRHVPTRFRSTFRLDLLSVPEAVDAIRLPALRAHVDFTEQAAEQLVDDLRRVRVQRPGGAMEEALGSYVEPVQLQVACRLLWSMLPQGAERITSAEVEALGRVDQALADYYADRLRSAAARTGVREADIREWFETRLITPQGLRGQVLEGPAPGAAGAALLAELVDAHLVRAETRRHATWYELAHDRLIEPVRRDNAGWRAEHQTPFERAAALWEQEGRSDRLLLLGPDLATALEDPAVQAEPVNAREREFLEASRRADEQARREARTAARLRRITRGLRIAVVVLAVTAVVSVLLTVVAVRATNRSAEERDRAEAQTRASRLLLEAQRNVDYDQDLAAALAVVGAEMYPAEDLPEHARDVLYRTATSPVSLVFRGQQGPTATAILSADRSTVVVAGAEDIRTWDRQTGEPGQRLALEDGEVVSTVDVTEDGRTVIAGLADGTLLVWDVGSADPLRWEEGTGPVWSVARSPDGERFASAGAGAEVTLWGLDGTQQSSFADPSSTFINTVTYSPDGGLLATVGDSPEVVFWDAATGTERDRLPLPEAAYSVSFGADAGTVATISPSAVTVWDVTSGQPRVPPFTTGAGMFRNLTGDLSQVMTVGTYGQVSVYDLATGTGVASALVSGASTWGAAFDFEPGRIFVVGSDISPAFWDLHPGGAYEYVTATAMAGDRIFSAWSDGSVQVWSGDAGQGSGGRVPGIEAPGVYELAATEDGRLLAAVTETAEVQLWDTTTGAALQTLRSDAGFTDVDITSDGALLVTADLAGRVGAWDTATGAQLDDVTSAQERGISELRVSPDGYAVLAVLLPPEQGTAAASGDDEQSEPVALVATLLNGGSSVALQMPDDGTRPPAAATAAPENVTDGAFSQDGSVVFVGTSEGRVAAFDVRTGDPVWPDVPTVHQRQVEKVLVAGTDGTVLTTAGQEVVLLDPADGTRDSHVPSGSYLEAALLTSDDDLVLLSSAAGTVTLPLDDGELLDLVRSKSIHELTDEECEYYRVPADC